jgi:hypothetical protein
MTSDRERAESVRRKIYEKDRGTTTLTGRQERRIRKAGNKAEFRRPKTRVQRVVQRAQPGYKTALRRWQRQQYTKRLEEKQLSNPRARLGRSVFVKRQRRT